MPAGVGGPPVGLEEELAAVVAKFAASDPGRLGGALAAERLLAMRPLLDQAEAAWLRLLATVDAQGAAGAEAGEYAPSTAAWLRARLRMGPGAARTAVRTARALHRGPLPQTAAALAAGEVSYQHAAALAEATHDLPPTRVAEAEPVLVDAARRLDPPSLRRLATHAREVIDPDAADRRGRARLERRGLWLSPTFEGMVDVEGLLDPEAGEAVRAALAPLARPTGPEDERSGAQRRADALAELARGALQADRLPDSGGLRPQVTVTVDLASLLAWHGVGGSGAWGGVFDAEVVRRLACDAVVTRAIVHRHPDSGRHSTAPDQASSGGSRHSPGVAHGHAVGGGLGQAATPSRSARHDAAGGGRAHPAGGATVEGDGSPASPTAHQDGGLAQALRAAVPLLPLPLGAPVEVLDLGRATRVVPPALRRALAVRDGGCVAPGCDRPPGWTDAHHLHHWLHGGPTSLDNLVLLCRVHHVAVHEGGWRLHHDPATERVTLTPPPRGQPRGHPPPAT
ncbi:MAG TPA: DUF222 domain-containing protein [Actinomycetota bacterium]